MATFVVVVVVFVASVLLLALGQWLRRAPLPVGCTPVNGECCRAGQPGGVPAVCADGSGAVGPGAR